MNNHRSSFKTIRTPLDTLNILGAGGLLEGTITELWGAPSSGKSAFAYDTASNFLDDHPTGFVDVIDPELSTDRLRLEHVFKLDMDRVNIKNSPTLEDGYAIIYDRFKSLEGEVKDKKPLTPRLIIWDTIASAKPSAEVSAALEGKDPVNAGGMGLRARINEINLAIVMSNLWGKPITIFLLNQIRTGFDSYLRPYETSSGGNALKHTCHYRLGFKKAKKVYDDELKMNTGTTSLVDIEKSKFGPTVHEIPVYIDDRSGGRIIATEEAAIMCWKLNLLNATGGPWYKFLGENEAYTWDRNNLSESSGRWISGNVNTRKKCLDVLARHFRMNYYLLDIVYKQLGLTVGELSEEQLKEREQLVRNFDFSKIITSELENENG